MSHPMNTPVRALLLAATVALAAAACGGLVDSPSAPPRVFESAFDTPAPGALPYDEALGPRVAISQRTLFVGAYVMDDIIFGFRPRCPTAAGDARLEVGRFRIMTREVTKRAYKRCIAEGRCPSRASDTDPLDPLSPTPWDAPSRELEPVAASPANAETFCRAYGGELPTRGQWHAAAGATDTTLATPWVTRRFPQCFVDPSVTDCQDFEASSPYPRRIAPGSKAVPLRPVATTPWDVSPEGVFDLYGNASEWLRPLSTDLPQYGCDEPALNDAAYHRGPRAANNRLFAAAAPAPMLVSAWFNYDGDVADYPGRLPPLYVSTVLYTKAEETHYRSGFRCVFPEDPR